MSRFLAGLGVALVSFVVGVGLAVVGGAAGPGVMVVAPVAIGAALLAFSRPVLAVALVLLALPVGLVSVPGDVLGLQVVQVVALAVTGVVVLRRLSDGLAPLAWSRPMWWAFGFVAWAFIATGSAVSRDLALKQDANLVASVLLVLVTVTVARDLVDVRRLTWVFLAAGVVMTAPPLASAGSLSVSFGGAVVNNRLQGTFAQPNELGAFAMLVVLVGAGVVLGARSRRERLLAALALVPAVACLALALSRGAWIGTVLGASLLLVALPSARRALLTVGLPVVLLGAALGAFAPDAPQVAVVGDRIATLRDPGGNPYDDRPRIWAEGRREVRADPLTGQGPGGFPVASTRSASNAQTVQAAHAHSLLLTTAAETGLPGAALLVGFAIACGFAVRDALVRVDDADRALVAGLAAALVGIAGQGLVDFVQRNAVLMVADWLVVGLLLAAVEVTRGRGAGTRGGAASDQRARAAEVMRGSVRGT